MRKVLYILGQLSDDDADWLARVGERRRLDNGDALVVQGRPIEWIYIMLDGRVVVTIEGVGEIAKLGAGEIVGEMSLVDSRPPSASVHARGTALALAVSKAAILERLESDVGFAARFYKAVAIFLSHRMRSTVRTLGYAKSGEPSLEDDEALADEVDLNVLDTVNKAGARFDRMLKRLMYPSGN